MQLLFKPIFKLAVKFHDEQLTARMDSDIPSQCLVRSRRKDNKLSSCIAYMTAAGEWEGEGENTLTRSGPTIALSCFEVSECNKDDVKLVAIPLNTFMHQIDLVRRGILP